MTAADQTDPPNVTFGAIGAALPWDFFQKCHEAGKVFWDRESEAWLVSGYDAVRQFSLDNGTMFRRPWEIPGLVRQSSMSTNEWADFQSFGSEQHIFRVFGPARDAQHRWWVRALSPAVLAGWRDTIMRPLAARAAGKLSASGQADLFGQFAAVVPAQVTAAILGAPPDDDWISGVLDATQVRAALRQYRGGGDPDPALVADARRATKKMHELFAGVVADRRRKRGSDLISLIWSSGTELFDRPFSDIDVVGAATMVWEAGTWSISLATGNALYLLATNPRLQEQLRTAPDDGLVDRFIEESLRLHGPVHARTERIAVQPCRLGDAEIAAGDRVIAVIGAANRDPDHYMSPNELCLDRDAPRDHFGFWKGPMICVGQGLSRMQVAVNVQSILHALKQLELDHTADAPVYAGATVRGWRPLRVRYAHKATQRESA